jgi:hypothetical protein
MKLTQTSPVQYGFIDTQNKGFVQTEEAQYTTLSIMTFSIMTVVMIAFSIITQSIMTFSLTTLSITTFRKTTFSIKGLFETHKQFLAYKTLSITKLSLIYAECHILFIVMLNAIDAGLN